MFNKNWWFLNFQKEFLIFSFCIRKLAVAFYMINEIQPKIKFQNIVQCPFNVKTFIIKRSFIRKICTQPNKPDSWYIIIDVNLFIYLYQLLTFTLWSQSCTVSSVNSNPLIIILSLYTPSVTTLSYYHHALIIQTSSQNSWQTDDHDIETC